MIAHRKLPTARPLGAALLLGALGACAARADEPASPATTAPPAPPVTLAQEPSASPSPSPLPPPTSAITAAAPPASSAPLSVAPSTAERARAVFDQRCASCHGEGINTKATKHFKLDHGALAGHHAGSLGKTMRQTLGMNGGKATMPPGGPALSQEEAQWLVSWAEEQDRSAPKHHDGHSH